MPPQPWLSLQMLCWMQNNPQEGFSQWLQHHVREYVDDAEVRCCPGAAWSTTKSQSELFSNCVQEYAHRFAIWLDNVEFIHSFNEEGKSFWVSLKLLAQRCTSGQNVTKICHFRCSSASTTLLTGLTRSSNSMLSVIGQT